MTSFRPQGILHFKVGGCPPCGYLNLHFQHPGSSCRMQTNQYWAYILGFLEMAALHVMNTLSQVSVNVYHYTLLWSYDHISDSEELVVSYQHSFTVGQLHLPSGPNCQMCWGPNHSRLDEGDRWRPVLPPPCSQMEYHCFLPWCHHWRQWAEPWMHISHVSRCVVDDYQLWTGYPSDMTCHKFWYIHCLCAMLVFF